MKIKIRLAKNKEIPRVAELISQLSSGVNYDDAFNRLIAIFGRAMEAKEIWVAIIDKEVVATASIFYEQKFGHDGGIVAHIEDVVVDDKYRGQGIGQALIKDLVKYLRETKECYKVILNCLEYNVHFYELCGFYRHDVGMRLDLK